MSDNEDLLRRAEGLATYRRAMLVVNAVSYVVWIGSFGLQRAYPDMSSPWLNIIGLVAMPVWIISLIALVWVIRRLAQQKQIRALIDDERTQVFTKRAFQAGYWALLIALAGLYAVGYVTRIDLTVAIPFLLALGVAVPPLTYAFLYRS